MTIGEYVASMDAAVASALRAPCHRRRRIISRDFTWLPPNADWGVHDIWSELVRQERSLTEQDIKDARARTLEMLWGQ